MRWGPIAAGLFTLGGGLILLMRSSKAAVADFVPYAPAPEDELPRPWKVSDELVAELFGTEGFRATPYDDPGPGRHCTVGFGHKIHDGPCNGDPSELPFSYLTRADADALARKDIAISEGWISRNVQVPLGQNQFDALVSFAYNVGTRSRHKVTDVLNTGNYAGAATALEQGPTAGGLAGLIARRKREAEKFRSVA